MASPDCDDGYMRLAHELFAALAVAAEMRRSLGQRRP